MGGEYSILEAEDFGLEVLRNHSEAGAFRLLIRTVGMGGRGWTRVK